MRVLPLLLILALMETAFGANTPSNVTFNKDILPILQKNCQDCHRPGETAPMSLLTYNEARPWAKAMKEAVLIKRMPPWFADPHFGKFINERRLTGEEIQKLASWADQGAPEGNAKDRPAPREFVDGWNIGKPDVTFEIPMDHPVEATGTIEYTYFVIPSGFTEDKWVQLAEVRPGNRAVVHHVIAFIREPGSKWLQEAKVGEPYIPKRRARTEEPRVEGTRPAGGEESGGRGTGQLLVGFAPGMQPARLRPGQARLVKAGSDIIFQMHYTASGKAATDRTRIGLVFAKEPVTERILTTGATNARFVIPAGAANHEVESGFTVREDVRLISFMPHMHLRGKDFEYRLLYPTGERQTILRVPKYDFNWQLFYYLADPLLLPKNTKIECTAHFDNSPNNPANPDPSKEVRWGDQSWEEMMIGWFEVAMDPKMDPAKIFRAPRAEPVSQNAGATR